MSPSNVEQSFSLKIPLATQDTVFQLGIAETLGGGGKKKKKNQFDFQSFEISFPSNQLMCFVRHQSLLSRNSDQLS